MVHDCDHVTTCILLVKYTHVMKIKICSIFTIRKKIIYVWYFRIQ